MKFFQAGFKFQTSLSFPSCWGGEQRQGGEGKRSLPLNPHQRLPSAGSEVACHGDLRSLTFEGEGESGKQTECCSGDFSLPPLGPLPTVFIDFNHWRLAGSQKKHCVMCSFLAFIKETQCSVVTLPSSPGNLPTPCGTSFIGADRARGLGLVYLFFF